MYHLSRSLLHKNLLKPFNHHVIKYYSNLRMERLKDIEKLPEIEQLNKFVDNVKREIDVRFLFLSFFKNFTLYQISLDVHVRYVHIVVLIALVIHLNTQRLKICH